MNAIEKLIDLIENPSTHPAYQLDVKEAIREAREVILGMDDLEFQFEGARADLSAADDELEELKGKLTSQAAEIANLKEDISRLRRIQEMQGPYGS